MILNVVAISNCFIRPNNLSFVPDPLAGPGMAGGLSADQSPPSLTQTRAQVLGSCELCHRRGWENQIGDMISDV